MALAKKNRLTNKKDFNLVLRKGFAVKGHFLLIKYIKTALSVPRFGFAVSLKVSGNAVNRNRIKRILSEVVRQYLSNKTEGYDAIIMVSRKEKEGVLVQELRSLLSKLP